MADKVLRDSLSQPLQGATSAKVDINCGPGHLAVDRVADGSMLASGSGLGTAGNWVDVFWSPVSVVPDTTLYLVFTSAEDTLVIAGDTSNPYSRGQVYANTGYGSFPTFDYTFRTYAGEPAGVPDATGTFALVGLAFVALISWRRNLRN